MAKQKYDSWLDKPGISPRGRQVVMGLAATFAITSLGGGLTFFVSEGIEASNDPDKRVQAEIHSTMRQLARTTIDAAKPGAFQHNSQEIFADYQNGSSTIGLAAICNTTSRVIKVSTLKSDVAHRGLFKARDTTRLHDKNVRKVSFTEQIHSENSRAKPSSLSAVDYHVELEEIDTPKLTKQYSVRVQYADQAYVYPWTAVIPGENEIGLTTDAVPQFLEQARERIGLTLSPQAIESGDCPLPPRDI